MGICFFFSFFFFAKNTDCGEAVLTSTHNLCFEQKYKNIRVFLSENLQFLVVKFSLYFE